MFGSSLLPERCTEYDAGVERDAENNPLGSDESRLVGGVQNGVREPLLLGGLGCTSVCIRRAAARWSLGSG